MEALTPLKRLLCGSALLACIAAQPAPAVAAAEVPLEYAVKANYLYKFAPFVRWPPASMARGAPFTICLIGETGFGAVLDRAVRGQAVDGHAIAVRRVSSAAGLGNCQILFVGRTAQSAAILRAAAAYPILTVTDHERGAGGGMIDFILQRGRVRFAIDDAAARASGLQISSKLLGLALAVNGR